MTAPPSSRPPPEQRQKFPPGHYYSPIPSLSEIYTDEERIFNVDRGAIAGVDLADSMQVSLLNRFSTFASSIPFQDEKVDGLRYYYRNPSFAYADGTILHCMLRHFRPRRLIEVGSGYSSAVTLDTNERFLNGQCALTFVEPYPTLLTSLLQMDDLASATIIPKRLQDVDPTIFEELESGDVLFIDSTHVSRIDSDVNHVFFDILPRLQPGVVVHFHDIFYPFEYPKQWIYDGIAWNEAYLLRGFLQYNHAFEVLYFNHYMFVKHRHLLEDLLPVCLTNPGGSIWLRRCEGR